jgi:hypothetical protein
MQAPSVLPYQIKARLIAKGRRAHRQGCGGAVVPRGS